MYSTNESRNLYTDVYCEFGVISSDEELSQVELDELRELAFYQEVEQLAQSPEARHAKDLAFFQRYYN